MSAVLRAIARFACASVLALGIAAGSGPPELALDPAAFKRTVDAMEDVVPATKQLVRMPVAIESASVEFLGASDRLRMRTVAKGLEVRAIDPQGNEVLLGTFAWNGPVVEWRWSRVGSVRMRDALNDADTILPTARLSLKMADGSERLVCAPSPKFRAVLKAGQPVKLRLVVPAGAALRCEADGQSSWSVQAPEAERISTLLSEDGEIVLSHDPRAQQLTVEWRDPVRVQADGLREAIAEKKREQSRRSPAEQRIVSAEIAALEEQLKALGNPKPGKDLAPVPPLRVVDDRGRTLATLTIEAR
jgi:hypothetical protein